MAFVELPAYQQLLAVGFFLAMLLIFTASAVFLSEFIQKRMRPDVKLMWPVGLSFFVSAFPLSLSNPEPIEELTILAFAHLGAWFYLIRRTGPVHGESQ